MDPGSDAALQAAVRTAHHAVTVLNGARAPDIDVADWRGPAAAAAREAMHGIDGQLRECRARAHAYLDAVRRAVTDG